MLIIGERINTSRRQVNEAVEKRDAAFIQTDVRAQVEIGAHLIDVNASSRSRSELADLLWLIEVIEEAVPVRLSLDSSDPHCLRETVRRVREIPMVNSITAEKVRFEKMVPVIQQRECDIVALCMDERGIPKNVDQVIENAEKLTKDLEGLGVSRERIYLDPLIQALSTNTEAGLMGLEAIERIHQKLPGVKTICGLSGALVDPLDRKLMSVLKATALVLGQDQYCRDYIRAYREGRLES